MNQLFMCGSAEVLMVLLEAGIVLLEAGLGYGYAGYV